MICHASGESMKNARCVVCYIVVHLVSWLTLSLPPSPPLWKPQTLLTVKEDASQADVEARHRGRLTST